MWRRMLDVSPPMAGLDSSFCTPWLVLRLAVYVYSTYTPSQNLLGAQTHQGALAISW